MVVDLSNVILSIVIGTLAAIVYTLRTLVLLDKKVTRLCEKQGINVKEFDR